MRAAELTRKFLESEFWNELMKPALGDEQSVKPWEPGDPRVLEQVAVDHLFASGKSAFAKIMLNKFQVWIKAGDEAARAIKLDDELRDNIREI